MKKCGMCGEELDGGVVVHRECLENSKAEYDKINDFEQSQLIVLLAENTALKKQLEDLLMQRLINYEKLQKENEELKEQLGTRIDKIVTAKNRLTKEVFIAKRSPLSYDIVLKDWNYRYTNEDESVEYDFRYCHEDNDHKSWEQAEQRLKELKK